MSRRPVSGLAAAALPGRALTRRETLRGAAALGLSLPTLLGGPAGRAAAQDRPVPPDAPREPRVSILANGPYVDPYAWLENPDDPEVIAYLEAENAYTAAIMDPTADLQETLYQELIGRIRQTDETVPVPWHGYLYSTRTEEGMDYPFIVRTHGPDAPEELLLDLNAIAGDYLELGYWAPSPDNRYLAYEIDPTGEEFWTIHVLDMETGREADQIPDATAFEWGNDSRSILYCKQDADHRPFAFQVHQLGADPATDPQIYREDDPEFWLYTLWSKDRTHFFLYGESFDTNEVRFVADGQPLEALAVVGPRTPGVRRFVDHHDDRFIILSDEDAPNFQVLTAPAADPAPENWTVLVPHRDDALIEWFDVFRDHLALYGREQGFSQIWVMDLPDGQLRPLAFDEEVYTAGADQNWEFDTGKLRIWYSSPVTPNSVYDVDMASGERTLLKQDEVVGGHDPSRFVTERLSATASDGVEVPISLVYLKDAPDGLPAGPRPLRLDGYGAYGVNTDPEFSILRLALIERGVTFAIAHVRGGQELGRRWWEEGRLLAKRNTFSDFIACAEHLIDAGYTAPDRLVIRGGSAGGLLMGVVATARPDLFKAVVAEVPLADMVGFLQRATIGPTNRDEFGNPADPIDLAYQLSYSPYQNVARQDYPTMLVTAGLNDNRVPYWVPAKWVARLRDARTDDDVLLLRTEMGSGHFGVSGFYDAQRETAFLYAFLLQALGMTGVAPNVGGMAAPVAAKRPGVAARSAAGTGRMAAQPNAPRRRGWSAGYRRRGQEI